MNEDITRATEEWLRAREADTSTPEMEWRAVVAELARRERDRNAFRPATPKATSGVWAPTEQHPRMERALADLSSVLVPDEKVEAFAIQHRLFALWHRRSLVAATSGRFVGMTRGLFGGFNPVDVRWQDLKDANVRVGIFSAELTIESYNEPDLATSGTSSVHKFSGLRKGQAESVYRICQAREQSWREKRRLRELEELRAKAGGVQIGQGGDAGLQTAGGREDVTTRLARAKAMLSEGLITDSEYEALKVRIINSL